MNVRGVHHVAMAVYDLGEAVETYTRLFGASVEVRGRMEREGVEAVYLRVGNGRVELVSPVAADTAVGRFLSKRGPGMHHVAFEVEDVEAAVGELAAAGAEVIDPLPREGLGGHEVSFVHPDSVHGVLAEVVSADA
ncbi:MAG: methylmalonyl-CoA epimerase [Actinomycetota bacterium]|nr:methylmalonyl-CoA epimerase [Actinomycetota bacterium]